MALPYMPLNIDVNDADKGGLYGSFFSRDKITALTQIRDNGLYLAIRAMQDDVTGFKPWSDVDISTATVSVSIDNPDLFPTSGTFPLRFGPTATANTVNGSSSVTISGSTAGIINGMNVSGVGIAIGTTIIIVGSIVTLSTPAIASGTGSSLYFYNQTASLAASVGSSNLQTALNSLASMSAAGAVTVSQQETDFVVTWNIDGVQPLIQGDSGSLYPASSIEVLEMQAGSSTQPEIQVIRVLQLPATFQGSFTPFPVAGATVSVLTAGGAGVNNLQRITLNPTPYAGNWVLPTSYGRSGPINASATGADVQAALQAIAGTPAGTWLVSGGSSGPYNVTNTTGLSVSALSPDVSGLVVAIGMEGELSLATPGMVARFESLPAGANSFPAQLEVQLQFPGEDPQTILQIPVTVNRNIIRNGAIYMPSFPTPASPAYVLGIIAQLFQTGSETVSTAGTDTPAIPLYCKQFTYSITAQSGTGAYIHATQLSATNRTAGDKFCLSLAMPASTNPTINILNNAGSIIFSAIGTGFAGPSQRWFTFGTDWTLDA